MLAKWSDWQLNSDLQRGRVEVPEVPNDATPGRENAAVRMSRDRRPRSEKKRRKTR
ncbi:protein of unknown function [Pararobbsia alpina]